MPYFNVVWDGMGFTRRESRTEDEMDEAKAKRYTKKLKLAGELPPGVVAVHRASVSADGKEEGEWKVFVSVELIVEAANATQAEWLAVPEEFLLKVADKMCRTDADATYGLSGTFEVLSVDEATYEATPVKLAVKARRKTMSVPAALPV